MITGVSLYSDIRSRLPGEEILVAFDVGANFGQSVFEIEEGWPSATIYTFEPVPETFKVLVEKISSVKNAHPINTAFGSKNGVVRFDCSSGAPDMFHIAKDQDDESNVSVPLTTLDDFCAANNIQSINFLKIDTEGHDLEVLKGARGLLSRRAIDIVQAECAANRDNDLHVPFNNLHVFLEDCGYRLFGIYEQFHEWPTAKPHLRRFNAAYISSDVIARNHFQG
jgi:FkbM family methyltransferase